MENCILCKIINGEIPANIIDQNSDIIVFTSLENHPLIVTKKHIKDIYELSDEDGAEIMKSAIKISKAAKSALSCDGINLVQSNEAAAGQDVFHFHLHIKPRWKNDKTSLQLGSTNYKDNSGEHIAELIKNNLPK